MMVNQEAKNVVTDQRLIWLCLLFFLLWPFGISLFLLFYSMTFNKNWRYVICSILFLALINITIDWESTDYGWYIPLYKDALEVPFLDYIWSLSGAKEPVYTILTYFISHIFGGNGILFSIFSTMFFYFFMIKGLLVIQKSLGLKRHHLFIGITLLLFFPYIFANSANHVRQYWATAIVFFSITKVLFEENKKYWILAGVAMFIHTSSGLMVLLALIPFLKYKLSLRTFIYYFLTFIILFSMRTVAQTLLPFLGDSLLNQALSKAAYGTYFETEFTMEKLVFAAIVVGVPLFLINRSSLRDSGPVLRLINSQLMLVIFIATNLEQEEFCVRMNEYIWCYMPANIMFAASALKTKRNTIMFSSIAIIFFFVLYQVALTQNKYYCGNAFLWQNSIDFFLQSKIE